MWDAPIEVRIEARAYRGVRHCAASEVVSGSRDHQGPKSRRSPVSSSFKTQKAVMYARIQSFVVVQIDTWYTIVDRDAHRR